MKTQEFGNMQVELTPREFELLANAFHFWNSIVLPNRKDNDTVVGINHLLQQFWFEYEKRPF